MTTPINNTTTFDDNKHQLNCQGDWTLVNITSLKIILENITLPTSGNIIIDGKEIKQLDSAGTWLLYRWKATAEKRGLKVTLQQFSEEHQKLFTIVAKELQQEKPLPEPVPQTTLVIIGTKTVTALIGFRDYLAFIGELTYESLRILKRPSHIRINAISSVIYRNGYLALPIIALLSLMIGVVITYQMGLQLKSYGANIYIVDLLGLAILREFGPLLTAIMIAGRTGSAFTAQLGMMKLNQEIDALDTMGVTPAELLLLPRIVGLFIALPLLTVWADAFGVFGGMIMANNMLSITWYDFLHRFPQVIPLRSLLIGLGKAPIFALIIASVGCYEGMRVKDTADSVGENTTRSVVLSIFFIIVADAIFSILLSKLKL